MTTATGNSYWPLTTNGPRRTIENWLEDVACGTCERRGAKALSLSHHEPRTAPDSARNLRGVGATRPTLARYSRDQRRTSTGQLTDVSQMG
ncbi:hypothetical protein BN12_650002 [Nostocoides japonicum T1-X7]|uniref:Uncharacterized protein n=1 Tax=Nostocoides japonicum T1-X7 TaxID=1194083 RepID=A0A077M250_9MICO|nr:hypothetical protein BN12_650002 [Tetrasphaera japonica T1-X7]